jgi:hypothetical protein
MELLTMLIRVLEICTLVLQLLLQEQYFHLTTQLPEMQGWVHEVKEYLDPIHANQE